MAFIPMPNKFQENKLIFFRIARYTESTRTTFWNLYINYIYDVELESNKDLLDFDEIEIKKCNEKVKDISYKTIHSINAFINSYMKYYKKEDSIFKLTTNKKIDNSWYINKSDFFNICDKVLEKSDVQFVLPLLLIRYGISGKQMIYSRTIRWKDINFNNNEVVMYNDQNEVILKIPVDDYFLNYMNLIKVQEAKVTSNIDELYILKRTINTEPVNLSTVNSRIYYACKLAEIPRISPFSLENSAKVEYLYQLFLNKYEISLLIIKEQLLENWYRKDKFTLTGKAYSLQLLFKDWLSYMALEERKAININVKKMKDSKSNKRNEHNDLFVKSKAKIKRVSYDSCEMRKDILNKIYVQKNYAYIFIEGTRLNANVKIDIDVINIVSKYNWYPNSKGILITKVETEKSWKTSYLANTILNIPDKYVIDYINGDKLDCRKENLTFVIKNSAI